MRSTLHIDARCNKLTLPSALRVPPGDQLMTPSQWDDVAAVLQLSRREIQVMRRLFDGQTREAIAAQLEIKPRTVRQYLERLHRKLYVSDRVSLVLRIIQIRDFLKALPTHPCPAAKETA